MQDHRFEKPVHVALGPAGNIIYTVERVAQAADILLNRWPGATGRSHVTARKACLAVLSGLKTARDARAAFVNAARDANILVDRDQRD